MSLLDENLNKRIERKAIENAERFNPTLTREGKKRADEFYLKRLSEKDNLQGLNQMGSDFESKEFLEEQDEIN
jgi:hypothetical protein